MALTEKDIERLEKYLNQRFVDSEKLNKALFTSLEERINAMNIEAQSRFPTRQEFVAIIEKIELDIDAIENSASVIAGKADQQTATSLKNVSLVGLFISFLSLLAIVIHLFVIK